MLFVQTKVSSCDWKTGVFVIIQKLITIVVNKSE